MQTRPENHSRQAGQVLVMPSMIRAFSMSSYYAAIHPSGITGVFRLREVPHAMQLDYTMAAHGSHSSITEYRDQPC